MYDDKYEQIKQLSKKNVIGVILIILFSTGIFISPSILSYYLIKNTSIQDPSIYCVLSVIICIALIIISYKTFCKQYVNISNDTSEEVRQYLIKEEISNVFNNYMKEDGAQTKEELEKLDILKWRSSYVDDIFTATYKNVKFKYADVGIYVDGDDTRNWYFKGQVFIFDLKKELDGDLYIGTKEKILFGYSSNINHLLKNNNYKSITPDNNTLNENIVMLSSSKPNIIEDLSFQNTMNDLLTNNMFIYKNNKLYVLNYNHRDAFTTRIISKKEEEKARESIKYDIDNIRIELDKIINHKNNLFIKDNNY